MLCMGERERDHGSHKNIGQSVNISTVLTDVDTQWEEERLQMCLGETNAPFEHLAGMNLKSPPEVV